MPVTTFDIPPDLLNFIDDLVRTGAARSRREIVVRALEIFVRLRAHRWDGPLIFINGVRGGLMSRGSVAELLSGLSDNELYAAGRRMGKTLKDLSIQRGLDLSRPESHTVALQMLEDFGWGRFTIDEKRITVTAPFLPAAVTQGYLETALSMTLNRVSTSEDINVFERSALKEVRSEYSKPAGA